jgi:hypothetical protein
MITSNDPVRWTAWFRWLGLTLVGLVAGMIVFIVVGSFLGEAGDNSPSAIFGIVLGVIFGTTFSLAHWLFLRRYLAGLIPWIIATIIAFALAAAIVFGLLDGDAPDAAIPLKISHAMVVGSGLGLAQWLVLRKKVEQAYRWIVFSIVGWVVGEITGILIAGIAGPPLDLMALFLVGMALPGIGMVWLLQKQSHHIERSTLVGANV